MSIQNKADREKSCRLRQSLLHLASEMKGLIEPLFSDRPVIKGIPEGCLVEVQANSEPHSALISSMGNALDLFTMGLPLMSPFKPSTHFETSHAIPPVQTL